MTSLPDWLVERAALDEVRPGSARERLDRADPNELTERIAAVRAANEAELASHPASAAVPQIEARIAAETRRRAVRRRQHLLVGLTSVASVVVVAGLVVRGSDERIADPQNDEITRVKGTARLLAFRQAGDHAEPLDQDAVVREGDLIQLRYNGGGQSHGVIASIDGAGVVTLHHPATEDAPPAATLLATKTTTLPHAYALDDAPRFERFFFITADAPIDLPQTMASLRAFAHRADCATASLDLPASLHQWSLRLRKPDSNQKAPTP